jgi:PEP-CTERM motif
VPVFFVLKLNQTNGVSTLWANPDLSTTEALNTVGATVTLTAVNGSTFDSVIFRGGDFGGDPSVVDYTGFSVHYGGDSPFSAIPEPSSALLLGMAGLAIGRRRR